MNVYGMLSSSGFLEASTDMVSRQVPERAVHARGAGTVKPAYRPVKQQY